MDTGSTLYKRCQASVKRSKARKRKEAARKGAITRRENQRKRNEEAGIGYLTDNEVKMYKKLSEKRKKEIRKKRISGIKKWNEQQKRDAEKRRKIREREKKELARKKEIIKRREARKLETVKRHRREKMVERARKRMLKNKPWKHMIRPYRVYIAANGHCLKTGKLGTYKTLEEARARVRELKEAEKNIFYERETKTYNDGTQELAYEYVIFKDLRDAEPKTTYLKNEFGKYVEHNVMCAGKNYEIIEKCKAKVEDTVWVYGYDPRRDRKTFTWVVNNVLNEGFSGEHDMKRIYLYHCKVVFRNDKNEIDIIICKTARDAARFYIALEKHCKKGPYLFMGIVTTDNAMCESLDKLLIEKTGWPLKKIRRNQHRF